MSTYIDGRLPRDEALDLLTRQDVSVRAFSRSWPAPRWIKLWEDHQPAATMVWLNGAYAQWYDLNPHEYIGKPDSVIWPEDVCKHFEDLDREAISKPGEVVAAVEPTPRGKEKMAVVRKMACRVEEQGIFGWAIYGEICPVEDQRCIPCQLHGMCHK